jgi:hypothetical protein
MQARMVAAWWRENRPALAILSTMRWRQSSIDSPRPQDRPAVPDDAEPIDPSHSDRTSNNVYFEIQEERARIVAVWHAARVTGASA